MRFHRYGFLLAFLVLGATAGCDQKKTVAGPSSLSSSFTIPVNGLLVPAGTSRQLPFFLRLDCGVASEGTLFISTDVAEPGGTLQTSQFQVRVGS